MAQQSRNAELEAAIRAAPDDLGARLVYGDWLQSAGDARGEWGALQAGLPAGGRTLHEAAIDFLAKHRRELLGPLGDHLDCVWIGWFGGFIDELRVHGRPSLRRQPTEQLLEQLLKDPICAFLRGFSLGAFGRGESQGPDALLELLGRVAPSLTMLERLVVFDSMSRMHLKKHGLLERTLARLPALKSLGLAALDLTQIDWSALPPTLETLNVVHPSEYNQPTVDLAKLTGRALKEVCLVGVNVREAAALARLPALERVRLVSVPSVANVVKELKTAGVLQRLKLLDVSHSDAAAVLREAGDFRGLWGVRLHGRRNPEDQRSLLFSTGREAPFEAEPSNGPTWLGTRLSAEGRDALSTVPLAGLGLYNESCYALMAKQPELGLAAARACVTMPQLQVQHAWDNVGVALGELHRFPEAELSAREGLLRVPGRANLYSTLTGALRCQGRLSDALALLPAMLKSMKPTVRAEELQAALLDVIVILDQAGDPDRALQLSKKFAFIEHDERIDAALWLLKPRKTGGKWLKAAKRSEHGVVLHAAAVHAVQQRKNAQALSLLERAKAVRYQDLHFLPRDARLAPLHRHPRFLALTQ